MSKWIRSNLPIFLDDIFNDTISDAIKDQIVLSIVNKANEHVNTTRPFVAATLAIEIIKLHEFQPKERMSYAFRVAMLVLGVDSDFIGSGDMAMNAITQWIKTVESNPKDHEAIHRASTYVFRARETWRARSGKA